MYKYSPRAGTDNPLGTKFWCQQKFLITLPNCCQFKKKSLWSRIFYCFYVCFFYIHIPPCKRAVSFFYLNDFLTVFPPYKSIRYQIWPCRKIGQGLPRAIIWTNYDGPKAPVLHTKPQGHWPFGSGDDVWMLFTKYGHGGHLGHVNQTPQTNVGSPIPLRLHMKFGFDWPSGFEEDL